MTWAKRILPLVAIALPVMLMLSALRTYRALDAQREVYLRNRASALAAQVETLPAAPAGGWAAWGAAEEPALVDLQVLDRGGAPELAPLFDGRELFRTEPLVRDGVPVFRAFVPVHAGAALQLARIDLREDAADFLVVHARHHLWIVLAGGALIVALSYLNNRAGQRAAAAERKQAELAHLARLGEMSAALAHEIRNPLGTIKGYTQMLGEQLHGQHQQLLAPVLAETTRLEALVRDLLLYGRPAAPRPRAVETADVEALLRQHHPGTGDVELRWNMAAFRCHTDPDMLEQILLNLIRNALDAVRGRAGAWVKVEAAETADSWVFAVADSGPGFSPEAERRLFEPFFTTKATGTGLGLAISRRLAEALGGSLRTANQPDGGARLECRLPRQERS